MLLLFLLRRCSAAFFVVLIVSVFACCCWLSLPVVCCCRLSLSVDCVSHTHAHRFTNRSKNLQTHKHANRPRSNTQTHKPVCCLRACVCCWRLLLCLWLVVVLRLPLVGCWRLLLAFVVGACAFWLLPVARCSLRVACVLLLAVVSRRSFVAVCCCVVCSFS
jgi:hypothetical protein